jgi:16S rRNA (uracil1498-N3)-methyltransferase
MRRFFLDWPAGSTPAVGQRAHLDAEESKHLLTVLRAQPGAVLGLTDGRGHAIEAQLTGPDRRRCEVTITAVRSAEAEMAPPRLHLACAVVKGRRFEFALEKAVELGAHVITPLVTGRGVVEPGDGKRERWRHLSIAALKQCGRCHLPELGEPAAAADLLARAPGPVCYGAAPEEPLAAAALAPAAVAARIAAELRTGDRGMTLPPPELLLFIGPEGGWTTAEAQLFAARGALPLDLGPHILRTETAAVVGLAAMQQVRRLWTGAPGPVPGGA